MATLDLRHVGKMLIRVLENKVSNFEIVGQIGTPVLTGAAATFKIIKVAVTTTLTIGSGLTITASNKIAVTLPALQQGIYDYNMEIIPLTGEVIRIIDQIHCTNE